MYQPKRIIVIGGNAAGPSAAAKAKRVNPDAEVLLFEAGEFISTGTCELPYLFSGEIKDFNKIIFFTPETFLKEKGVQVFNNHIVKEIDIKCKGISVINKKTNSIVEFEYDKLILTTGSTPNEISDLPFTLENVFSLKSVQDYIKINSYLSSRKVQKILIVGSGYIGLEVADSLNKADYQVSILEKEQLPLPLSDKEVQFLIQDLLTKNSINFLSNDDQTKFIIGQNKLSQLKYNGLYIDFDLAIIAAGIMPNNRLATESGLKIGFHGGLIVDSKLKTSNPNIYAAGDNIEVKNFITRKNDYMPLATHAHSYGHIAGENAAGGNKIAEPVILNSAFQLCGKFISQVGLTLKQAEEFYVNSNSVSAVANNKVKVMPDSNKVFGKIIYDKYSQLILGASFVGSQEVSGYADLISIMIRNKISAMSLAETNFNYTPPLSPFVNLLSILGRKIKENN